MIIGHLGLLELKLSDRIDEGTKQNFEMAIAGGMRMKTLIDDLLEYSRVESRGRPFEYVKMNEAVGRAAQNIAKTMEEVRAELEVHPIPSIWADEMQMTQLVQNLLSNAMKLHGKEKPRVEISSTEMNAEIVFAVKDNGIGLNMAYADRIFQMFQRLNSGSKYPGTGIGLAIAKKIIERHSGRIWVESEEGKGATFFFSIPRKDNAVAPSAH
jgi:light-regulated signal transduction histidine kinase (bacteriophytochrome)